MFGQTFSPGDLATIAVLVLLEGLMSLDNALVLGILAGRLPQNLRMRALSYGLIGALVFRIVAVGLAVYLLRWAIIKLIGGAYLVWVAAKYFISHRRRKTRAAPDSELSFWSTVLAIELTDVAFATDSILAAVALVGPPPVNSAIHPKTWVIITGGMLGVIFMRFAAAAFARLLERFPRLHRSAYLLVLLIGLKLMADWAFNSATNPHRLDFQNAGRLEFWFFWGAMAIGVLIGLLPGGKSQQNLR
jgi:YkoY family integral membrane protein